MAKGDLHRGLVAKLKDFLIELGRDFCFVGSHYPVQVGNKDFELDLLFFHRGLNCLVAIELKIEEFQPEHMGKLEFYLEALDRDVKKPHEQPSIGVLLCATKDHEVVEYARWSRAMSPAVVAQYRAKLPDRELAGCEAAGVLRAGEPAEADCNGTILPRRRNAATPGSTSKGLLPESARASAERRQPMLARVVVGEMG